MRPEEGHISRFEVSEGRHLQGSGLFSELRLPEISNISFEQLLEGVFCWRLVKEYEGVGETICVAKISDSRKPRLVTIATGYERLPSYCVKNVSKKAAVHTKKCQLFKVELCFTWQGAGHHEDEGIWSPGVKLKKILYSFFNMVSKDVNFRFAQNKSCSTREEYRGT